MSTDWLSERLAALNACGASAGTLTISVGFAQTSSDSTIAETLAQADRRMYGPSGTLERIRR